MDGKDDNDKIIPGYRRCDGFFKEVLDEAMQKQDIRISDEAAFYLMGLLITHLKRDAGDDTKGLGERYRIALLGEETELLKAVGDKSLIIAGIWWQSLLKRLLDVDYYIEIGRSAYKKAGESTSKNVSEVFEELSENFVDMVNILSEATSCISEANPSNTNILRMYEVWLRTHSPMIAKKLRELGINPVDIKTTKQ